MNGTSIPTFEFVSAALDFISLVGTSQARHDDDIIPNYVSNDMTSHTLVQAVKDVDHDAAQSQSNHAAGTKHGWQRKALSVEIMQVCIVGPKVPSPPCIRAEISPAMLPVVDIIGCHARRAHHFFITPTAEAKQLLKELPNRL